MGTAVRGVDTREDFAREAGPAADVEDKGGGGEREEGEGAVCHCGLDVLDARGGGVFAGFRVVVEEVWRAAEGGLSVRVGVVERWRRCFGGGGAYRVSSGRDICADRARVGERFGTFSVIDFKDDAHFCYLMFSPGIDCRVVLHSAHVGACWGEFGKGSATIYRLPVACPWLP